VLVLYIFYLIVATTCHKPAQRHICLLCWR